MAFSSDSRTLASASDDGTIRLWNLATSREIQRFSGVNAVHFLNFSADGETLAAGGTNHVVQLWRAAPLAQIEAADQAAELGPASSASK